MCDANRPKYVGSKVNLVLSFLSERTRCLITKLSYFSFGGPESKEDVIPFLKNVTAGKDVLLERLQEVASQYDLFDGVSPINQQNRDFIIALKEELRQHDLNLPIYFGNRNWEFSSRYCEPNRR